VNHAPDTFLIKIKILIILFTITNDMTLWYGKESNCFQCRTHNIFLGEIQSERKRIEVVCREEDV
jgi:hypothetical protein